VGPPTRAEFSDVSVRNILQRWRATQPFAALATGDRRRSVAKLQYLLIGDGFGAGRWGWLDASPHGIGLITAKTI